MLGSMAGMHHMEYFSPFKQMPFKEMLHMDSSHLKEMPEIPEIPERAHVASSSWISDPLASLSSMSHPSTSDSPIVNNPFKGIPEMPSMASLSPFKGFSEMPEISQVNMNHILIPALPSWLGGYVLVFFTDRMCSQCVLYM